MARGDDPEKDRETAASRGSGIDAGVAGRSKAHAAEEEKKRYDYSVKDGYDGFSVAGLRTLGSSAGTSAVQGKSASKRAAERAYTEAMLQAIQSNSFGAYVAEQVFGSMNNREVSEIVARIEAETGDSFESYARGILGDEAVQRQPGESLEDYHRRLLMAVTEEIVVVSPTGEGAIIKPEYADDPMAQILVTSDVYQEIVAELQRIDESDNAAEAERLVQQAVEQSYMTADLAGNKLDDSEHRETASEGQDGQVDQRLDESAALDRNQGFFAGLGGSSPVEEASREGREEFNRVAGLSATPSPDRHREPDPAKPPSPFA